MIVDSPSAHLGTSRNRRTATRLLFGVSKDTTQRLSSILLPGVGHDRIRALRTGSPDVSVGQIPPPRVSMAMAMRASGEW